MKSNRVKIVFEEQLTCNGATAHFVSGCELLKHYDKDADGSISMTELGDALTDRDAGIITEKEAAFVSEAWKLGTINALCPGCY